MSSSVVVEEVGPNAGAQLDEFFVYLRHHVAENGASSTGYFQPLPRSSSIISAEREERFRNALAVAIAQPGWRRLWLARSPEGSIAGHIDLRSHNEDYATHRCLLGMGVHTASRRSGVGRILLGVAAHWAHTVAQLEWIDLQVLSANEAAKRLYHRFGFATVGEVPDMFKIDDQRFGYTHMALRLSRDA